MDSEELKLIKKRYGENFSHLCRNLFPTILETEGLLTKLLETHFLQSRDLYKDLIQYNLQENFKNYIFSLLENNKEKEVESKTYTPEELFDKAGYKLSRECEKEEDIQAFRRYYYRGEKTPKYNQGERPVPCQGEELCTFNGGRLKNCRVWFAVRKDVDKIKREDFKNPRREDDYGVSVLSIQFSRGKPSYLSIKNRYNHTVINPDATFSNNLDNIIPGLTQAFANTYGIKIDTKVGNDFEIPGYVQASDGKFYKYNHEINNIYYCPNNIIIKDGKAIRLDPTKCILFDYFVLDLEKLEIIDYDCLFRGEIDVGDSFCKSVGKIKSIKRLQNSDGLTIQITPESGEAVEIKLNKNNQIIGYINSNVKNIGDNFLFSNKALTSLELPNVESIGHNFLDGNRALTSLELPKVENIRNGFLRSNKALTSLELPNVKSIGYDFLHDNKGLTSLELPNVKSIGNDFLRFNTALTSLELPKVESIGNAFLSWNEALISLQLPNVESIGYGFLRSNEALTRLEFPNVKSIGDSFLYQNKALTSLELPNVESIGHNFLDYNKALTRLELPNVESIGEDFLRKNKVLTSLVAPKLESIGEGFLYYNSNIDLYNKLESKCK